MCVARIPASWPNLPRNAAFIAWLTVDMGTRNVIGSIEPINSHIGQSFERYGKFRHGNGQKWSARLSLCRCMLCWPGPPENRPSRRAVCHREADTLKSRNEQCLRSATREIGQEADTVLAVAHEPSLPTTGRCEYGLLSSHPGPVSPGSSRFTNLNHGFQPCGQ